MSRPDTGRAWQPPSAPAGATDPGGEADRLARAALSAAAEPGDVRIAMLVRELGAGPFLQRLRTDDYEAAVLKDLAPRIEALDPARDLELADRLGVRFVVPGDLEWPSQLDDLWEAGQLYDRGCPPIGLWVRGPVRLDELADAVAVVGSRSATAYGVDAALDIGAGLGRAGVPVVSGLAFGIDQGGHRGAMAAGGVTVAVMACGVDRCYPAGHRPLFDHIVQRGAIVSEVPLGTAPMRMRFLARNRLIAALGRGTVVVEAAIRSGALNTANWTERLHRVLMAVPGPITQEQAQGVHELIRSGAASLVSRAEEVLELVGASGAHLLEERRAPVRTDDRLNPRERQVLDAVPKRTPAGAESISRTAGMNVLDVESGLIRLRDLGLVAGSPDRGWRLTAPSDRGTGASTSSLGR